jgi:Protein of unknown function (DUF2892)
MEIYFPAENPFPGSPPLESRSITSEVLMFYIKNVPSWERTLRVVAGVATIAYGLFGLKGTLVGYLVAASGVIIILTGFTGFCPMCALAGRRLKN